MIVAAQFGQAIREAREALAVTAVAEVEGHARNTLGFSLALTGEVDEGAAELRKAIRIAREHDAVPDLGMAYVNYADMLHILGRSDEARAVVAEGRQAVAGWPILMLWLDTKLAEIAFDVGECELSGTCPPRSPGPALSRAWGSSCGGPRWPSAVETMQPQPRSCMSSSR
jgi:ATP/maltotriose-dependent transcriptional regulator MalT